MNMAVTFLAGTRPRAEPGRRDVSRRFEVHQAVTRVIVKTRHPQLGVLLRGVVVRLHSQPWDGALSRWMAVDPDHRHFGPIVGDYLDAERVLLDATVALDEPVAAGLCTEPPSKEV